MAWTFTYVHVYLFAWSFIARNNKLISIIIIHQRALRENHKLIYSPSVASVGKMYMMVRESNDIIEYKHMNAWLYEYVYLCEYLSIEIWIKQTKADADNEETLTYLNSTCQ